ncbi:sugar phosphate isomerase/epimerase family protein [Pedobacter arcticus]|uniref:sugar phosphate isomerase/epimerase family protein n=1 Tax=Pedobacter arcticus TaxID=752140 RepID=UPI00030E7F0A|nr:sugar phosphate isomerase/epimerase [Pedobacter arcticus]
MKKREFLTQIGILTAGALVLPSINSFAGEKHMPFGIQLYSLRNELPKGVETVISKVAKAGYSYVEAYGYSFDNGFWGLSAKEFRVLLDKYHLTCPSAHYDFNDYEKSGDVEIIKKYIATAKTLGSDYIVIPHINPNIYKDLALTKAWLAKINIAAKMVKDAGLKLSYHNHDFEFVDLGNTTAYEMLLNGTNPDLVDFEMDIYWVVRAKKDPLQFFKDHPGRFKLWHIKDMKKTDRTKNAEIGAGTIDYPTIIKGAKKAGLKYVFMEQENFDIDPYISISISSKYLQKVL